MRRRRYWYTFFLFISLGVFVIGTGRTEGRGNQQKKVDAQTEQIKQMEQTEQVADKQESWETLESISGPESVVQETEPKETEPSYSPVPESSPLFPDDFQEVLFVGDSRTVGLYEYGQMGEADVFADSGMSVFNLWDSRISFSNDEKKTLEQVLTENRYGTIHVMLGINELGYSMEQSIEKYRESVEKIQAMQPDAKVVLGANLHVTAEKSAKSTVYNNQRIDAFNLEIKKVGDELDCYYIDVNKIFDDEKGNLSKEYSTDGSHILGKYYADWVQWMLAR